MTFKDELIEILREEIDFLRTIKELAYEKTDVIINNEVDSLENITKKEEELINRMAQSENKRMNLLNTWGVDKSTPLSKVIENIHENNEDLINLGEELTNILVDIQSRNNTNSELINENLEWLDFNMNLITEVQISSTYGKDNKSGKVSKNIFDKKV